MHGTYLDEGSSSEEIESEGGSQVAPKSFTQNRLGSIWTQAIHWGAEGCSSDREKLASPSPWILGSAPPVRRLSHVCRGIPLGAKA